MRVRVCVWFSLCCALLVGIAFSSAAGSPTAGNPVVPAAGSLDRPAGDDPVLVKFDGVPYRKSDLVAYTRDVLGKNAADNGYLESVDDLVVDLTVYEDALAEMPSLREDPYVRTSIRKLRSRVLAEVIFDEEIRKKIDPSVDEVMKTLPDPRPKYEISVIVCHEEEKAWKAEDALKAGTPFADAAREYSDGIASHKGGYIGAVEDGKHDQFTKEEFDRFRELPEGKWTAPFKTRVGHTIVRMDKRWTPEEIKRNNATDNHGTYRAEARKKAFSELTDGLFDKAEIVWSDDVLARVKESLGKSMPEPLRISELVRVNGETIYVLELEGMGMVHSPESLDLYLQRSVRNLLLAQEAAKRGYEKRVAMLLDVGTRRAVSRRFFKVKAQEIQLSDGEVREYYAAHADRFMTEEAREIQAIETSDRKKAEEAAKKAGEKGADFGALAARYAGSEEHKKLKGEAGFVTRKMLLPEAADRVFAAVPGSVVGPLSLKDKDGNDLFVVIKVKSSRKRERIPFEKVNRVVLVDRIVSGKMEEFYKGFLGKASGKHKVEMFVNNGAKGEGNDAVNL